MASWWGEMMTSTGSPWAQAEMAPSRRRRKGRATMAAARSTTARLRRPVELTAWRGCEDPRSSPREDHHVARIDLRRGAPGLIRPDREARVQLEHLEERAGL